MDVKFAVVEKRINSTLIPSRFTSTYQCVLKEGCSVLNPVISLSIGLLNNPSTYNYAEIESFNRYYYIKNWTFSDGLWHAEMQVDILATYKADILESSAYVVRASKTYDGNLIDIFYPAKTSFTSYSSGWGNGTPQSPWKGQFDQGTYIVGIINKDDSSIGSVSYYAFTPTQFASLKYLLLDDANWTDIETPNPDLGINLYKSLFNPFQYFTTIKWFPFTISSDFGSYVSTLDVGWWSIPAITCLRLRTFFWGTYNTLSFNAHPLSSSRGNYLNCAPYSTYTLYAPPFGEIELDASKFAMATYNNSIGSLQVQISVDLISGQAVIEGWVTGEEASTVLKMSTQLSIDIQLAQLYSDFDAGQVVNNVSTGIFSMAKDVVNTVRGMLPGQKDTSDSNTDSIVNKGNMVADALAVGTTHLSQIGSNGSLAQFQFPFILLTKHKDVADDDNTDFGRPYCKVKILSDVSPGYVQTINAHISITGFAAEAQSLNQYLDGGVYIE